MTVPTSTVGDELPAFDTDGFMQSQVIRYAEASGDRNPIHTDATAARSAGLAGCVVHGMLLVGQFEEMIRHWHGGAELVATSTRFINPLLVDERLTITGRIVAQHAIEPFDRVIRLIIRGSDGRIICLSDAQVRLDATA